MLSVECQRQLVRLNSWLWLTSEIVSDYFGRYVGRNIAFSILVVAELRPAHTHFCGQTVLGEPRCLSTFPDLTPEFFLPRHCQYIDRRRLQM